MTKKILSMALAIAMVMALAVTASAASITITPPALVGGEGEAETGITYTAYKIFDATYADEDTTEGDVTNATKIVYTIDSGSPFFTTIQNATEYFTLAQVNGSTKYTVTVNKTNYTADAANTFADTLEKVATTGGIALEKQADGTYMVDELAKGYYLVTSSVGSDLILETLGDAKVNAKNDYPTLAKAVMEDVDGIEMTDMDATWDTAATAQYGQSVKFQLTVTVNEDVDKNYVITDTIPDGMTYDVASAKIDGTTNLTEEVDGQTIEWTIPQSYLSGKTSVVVTYTAKVDTDAPIATAMENVAQLTYGTYTTPKAKATVTTLDFDLYKVDTNQQKLDGAEFKLYTAAEGGTEISVVGVSAGVYRVAVEGETGVAIKAGTAVINGLDKGTYYLEETLAPDGYNMLTERQAVDAGGEITVVNSTGTELPSTGGIGTTIFYALGAVMVIGAGVLLVAKKRMSVEG